ncbi:hypothetical protein ACLK2E_14855 [Escherichia coli]
MKKWWKKKLIIPLWGGCQEKRVGGFYLGPREKSVAVILEKMVHPGG